MKTFNTVRAAQAATTIVFAACALVACGSSSLPNPPTPHLETVPATPTMSALPSSVVGTLPAGPTQEATATTSPVKSQMSKEDESSAMPLPGQANDHSTLSPQASQKAGATKR